MYQRANGGRVDLLLFLDNGEEDLGTGFFMPEVFFYSLSKLKRDESKHIFSDPSKIVAVEVAYGETISLSVPNPRSCSGLDPLETFLY